MERGDPSLDELGTFIYDGACGFCTRWAQWLARRLPDGGDVRSYQSIDDLESFGLSETQVRAASYWVTPSGVRYGGARAFAMAFRHGRGFWRVLGGLLGLPGVRNVAAIAYRWVARNRHRLPAPSTGDS